VAVSKILIIDDHYEVQDFLRSMLELASEDFQVDCVPSAEEGWLELLRVRFDLLITDLRLPGMNGFELIRMAQKRFPHLPIFLITGTDSEENREQAEALNVPFFGKPLDTTRLMQAVEAALGVAVAASLTTDTAVETPLEPTAAGLPPLPPVIVRRIDNLLAETSADQVLLATPEGVVRHSSGRGPDLPLAAIVANACGVIARAMQLGAYLSPDGPATLQYHRGATHDLYCASVGEQYVLLALVRSQKRRARVGTMWVFFQRAVNDILAQLAELARMEEVALLAGASDLAITRPLQAAADKRVLEEPEAQEDPPPADEGALNALDEILAEPEPVARTPLDDFWDSAVEDSLSAENHGNGLSLEEARRQGLLPADFGADLADPGDA
jgi:CheY-like chemotaxis protein